MQTVESADGTRIAYEALGSGPPLVLVGGAFCDRRARTAGLPLARVLAIHFTVYCVDRRGRGESGDTRPYAVEREVEDLAAIVTATGPTPYAYGHSSGAILLLECALRGAPFRKLALYEPPLVLPELREPVPGDMADQLRALCESGQRAEATELFLTRAIGIPAAYVQQMKSGPNWSGLESLAHTLSYDATITREPQSVLSRARDLRLPTLVLDGARSQGWMRAAAALLAAAIPGSESFTVPEQNHDVVPERLAPSLRAFFTG